MIRGVGLIPMFGALILSMPPVLNGQAPTSRDKAWEFTTRVLMTGTSRASEPSGYKAYTAFPVELALRRAIVGGLGAELAIRNESREIDRAAVPTAVRLGSIEFLPASLLLQFRRAERHAFRPYLGAGANLTVAWEKSGTLDSMAVSPSFGPAVQLGAELSLNRYLDVNLDFRWNAHRTNVEAGGIRVARLLIDAASFGIGVGARF